MMHKSLRPHITTGVAIAGAALIAVVPAAPRFLDAGHQPPPTQQRAVTLTTDLGDVFTPYADLITNTANNLAYLGVHLFDFPILTQFFSDPIGTLTHIPDALIALNTLLPSIDVTSSGLPIQIGAELTPPLNSLLALIGPFVTFGNAFGDIINQVLNLGNDPLGALYAILDSPATLLDAVLNGKDGLDVAGFSAPAFNGLLVPGQALNVDMTVGQLVGLAGVGDTTIGELADQTGLADQSVASLVTGLLNFVGIGNPTITELADQFGLGDQSVADLAIQLLGAVGIDNPTITDLADQFGVGPESLASVLIQVLDLAGFSTDQSMTTLALMALNAAGFGTDPSLGDLGVALLNALGMGNMSVADLVEQFIPGTTTLGDLAKQAVALIAPGNPTITGLLDGLGMGDLNLGTLVTSLLDSTGLGQQTPLDIFNSIFNPTGGLGPTLGQLIVNILQTENAQGENMDYTLSQLLTLVPDPNDPNQTYADLTIGDLLQQALVPEDTTDPYLEPYAGQPMGNVPWADFLSSDLAMGMGTKTIADLAAEAGQPLTPTECTLAAPFGIDCDETLSGLMGSNTVSQTLGNLHADGHGVVGVPSGTSLTDINLGQLVAATGQGDEHLSSIVLGLNMDTPMTAILTTLGLDDVTIDQIFLNGFPWLANTTVVSLLDSWGLNNLDINTVIDRLGLDMTISSMLNSLGLDQISLTSVVQDMLGGVQVSTILDDLGLGDVTLATFLNNLLGGVYVGDILTDLGLNDVHLNDVITDLLGGVPVSDILTDLGLDNVHLDDVVNSLLGDVTVGSILNDLGVSDATVNNILDSLGLSDVDVLGVNVGDFFGLLPNMFLNTPQQIADALAG